MYSLFIYSVNYNVFFWICNASWQLSDGNEGLVGWQCNTSEINNIFPVK